MLGKVNSEILQFQKMMLFLIIIFLPLNHFPKAFTISALGNNLAYYPLILGLFAWAYESYGLKQVDIKLKYRKFFIIYLSWQVICTIIGLYNFAYYNLITLEQIDKLNKIILFVQSKGLYPDISFSIKLWLFFRFLKDVIKDGIFIFGLTLWTIHLYQDKWQQGFREIRKAVLILVLIMCAYSVVEIASLNGNILATQILIIVNHFLYDVQSVNYWWPPLLWEGQLRSICAEPSFFGIIATFTIPFLISFIFELKYSMAYIIFIFYSLMLFLTKSRTATVLYLGEILLFFAGTLRYYRKCWKRVIVIFIIVLLSFLLNIMLPNWIAYISDSQDVQFAIGQQAEQQAGQQAEQQVGQQAEQQVGQQAEQQAEQQVGQQIDVQVGQYVDNNIVSVVSNKRSNMARLASITAQIKVGLQHPIFGVGNGLKDGYVNNNLPEWANDDDEVRNWSRNMYMEGILKSGFPSLNKFSSLFCQSGFLGLILYLIPIFYVIIRTFKGNCLENNINLCCVLIAFLGSLAAMFSNTEFLSFYILLGLLLCYIDGAKIERKD